MEENKRLFVETLRALVRREISPEELRDLTDEALEGVEHLDIAVTQKARPHDKGILGPG